MAVQKVACLAAIRLLVTFALAHPLGAQGPSLPTIRPLGPVVATASDSFGSIRGMLRLLSDGRILITDDRMRRVVLLDSTLKRSTVVLDTAGIAGHRYPQFGGNLVPFRGDTTLFFDATAEGLLVIGPDGSVGRSLALPKDAPGGAPFDAQGRMYYTPPDLTPMPIASSADAKLTPVVDTVPLVRVDLATRRMDTVAFIRKSDRFPRIPRRFPDGSTQPVPTLVPRPYADQWILMGDGTVAIVRSHDYHIDWVSPDGRRESSAKLAHHWERIPDSVTVALVDSLRAEQAAHPQNSYRYTVDGVEITYRFANTIPDADQVPDYMAPIAASSAVLSDADGNIWIKQPVVGLRTGMFDEKVPLHDLPEGLVYDLVNRSGTLFDRVQIPGGTTIVGFGPGVVYLFSRTGKFLSLARARVR